MRAFFFSASLRCPAENKTLRAKGTLIFEPRFSTPCNGRALDRVTRNKSIDQIAKNCPKNVRKLCFKPLWTIFGHFSDIFRHFLDILSTFPFSGLSNDLPVTILPPARRDFSHAKKGKWPLSRVFALKRAVFSHGKIASKKGGRKSGLTN